MPPTNADATAEPTRPARRPDPARVRWHVRTALLAVGVGLAAVFGVAAGLNPYREDGTPRTMATHRQLGIPECNFVTLTGRPCPSCGMTTSFALLVRGDVRASLRANWVGTLLALFWAALLPWALAGALVGRPLLVRRGRGELALTVAVGFFLALMLARWAVVLLQK